MGKPAEQAIPKRRRSGGKLECSKGVAFLEKDGKEEISIGDGYGSVSPILACGVDMEGTEIISPPKLRRRRV